MKPSKELLDELVSRLEKPSYIHPQDIPDIELYMDQVTTFMDDRLTGTKRHPEDKALTKTMINNYAKDRLLPSPNKKKYSKDHMLLLIFIYYFKNLISLSDIETIFAPMTEKHFGAGAGKEAGREEPSLSEIYSAVVSLCESDIGNLKPDIRDKYNKAAAEMKGRNCPAGDRDYLTLFTFICELAFDVYQKKQMIEAIADVLAEEKVPLKGKKA
jgi:hypothetical protein